jgi:GntR family transcriptional regulator
MIWTIDHRAPTPLRDQIAACVRRNLATGELRVGAHLPPATELADSLSVDRNTVLAAYRQLRDRGVLEFRRGRGVRVASGAGWDPAVVDAATALIDIARTHRLGRADLVQLIEELT